MTAPYTTTEPTTPALGLIVLRVDETIEREFRTLLPADAARLHVSRIQSGDELTPDSIHDMGDRLTDAAALLPAAAGFDVIGYACTSATAQLGANSIRNRIAAGIGTRTVPDQLTAVLAQIASIGLFRVGVISPYAPQVTAPLLAAFAGAGITVPDTLSFNESTEARVARIDPAATFAAAERLAARTPMDGLFLSCTNLQTLPILRPLQTALGIPVLSSNHALAWHMAQLAGVPLNPLPNERSTT